MRNWEIFHTTQAQHFYLIALKVMEQHYPTVHIPYISKLSAN